MIDYGVECRFLSLIIPLLDTYALDQDKLGAKPRYTQQEKSNDKHFRSFIRHSPCS